MGNAESFIIYKNTCMKKLISLICIFCIGLSAFAEPDCEQVECYEHLFCEKGAIANQVAITNLRNIICKGGSFKVAFNCKFKSECAKAGDTVNFTLQDALYTQEGRLLIPQGSIVAAEIIRIEKQRIPNKNARVYLNFKCIVFPDNTSVCMSAKPLTKDASLKEGPWMTTGKLALYTIGLGCVGAGAGVGFSFIPNPAKIGVGLAVGIPVGCTVGLITGLITPGLKYHAKKGEIVTITLCEPLGLPKICK